MDTASFYTQIPDHLRKAQKGLEDSIEAHAMAGDLEADATAVYRKAKAESVRRLKGEGFPVTLVTDLAAGEVADLKKDMLKAKVQSQKTKMLCEAYKERIFTLRYLGRSTEPLTK